MGCQAGEERQADGDDGSADDDGVQPAEDQGCDSGDRYGPGDDPAIQPGPSSEQDEGHGQHGQGGARLHPRQPGQQGVIGVGAVGPA